MELFLTPDAFQRLLPGIQWDPNEPPVHTTGWYDDVLTQVGFHCLCLEDFVSCRPLESLLSLSYALSTLFKSLFILSISSFNCLTQLKSPSSLLVASQSILSLQETSPQFGRTQNLSDRLILRSVFNQAIAPTIWICGIKSLASNARWSLTAFKPYPTLCRPAVGEISS